MKTLLVFAQICLWIGVFGEGVYHPHLKNGIKAYVTRITSDHRLSERSTDNDESVFGKIVIFKITLVDGSSFDLVLRRSDREPANVKVKVADDSGEQTYHMNKPKDYRFYQALGDDHGAAVMVRCPGFTENCHIAGSFHYGGNEYVIDPETGLADRVKNIPHMVHKVRPGDQTYEDDTAVVEVNTGDNGGTDKRQESKNLKLLSRLLNLLHNERRTKRQAATRSFKIELEMVICDDIFEFWMNRTGQNRDAAIEKIVEYFEQVANNMDLRYSSVTSSTMDIDIIPYLINIRETSSQCSWVTDNIVGTNEDGIEAYDAGNALDSFETWGKSNKDANSDAIMSFSRRDMWSNGVFAGRFTSGLARSIIVDGQYASATCRTSFLAASIVEDLNFGDTSSTAAHELAHNLGVRHDSILDGVVGTCPDSSQFIMAASSGFVDDVGSASNPWTFSPCSISEMERTLDSLTVDGDGLTCLERSSYDITDYNRVLTSDQLGQIYSRDEQCELLIGQGSTYCDASFTGVALDEICWKGMPCATQYSTFSGACIGTTYKFPASGTSCGDNKQCYKGLCTDSANIPPADVEGGSASSSTTSTSTTTTSTTTTSTTTTSTTTTTTPTSTTTTTTTPTTTTTTPTTTTTTPTTTTTTPTTTTTTPTTTTTTPTTTTTTPTTTTPTTTTTTPTTSATSTTTPTTTTSTTTTTSPTTTTTSTTTTTTPTTTTTTTTSPTTTTTTPTTTTTTPMTTTTTPTTTTTSEDVEDSYTPEEIDFLYSAYRRCYIYCNCWKRYCSRRGRTALCKDFAPECYNYYHRH